MARTIAERQLRSDCARVIAAVAAGESFVVTRDGVPVAELRPVRGRRRALVPRAEVAVLASAGPPIDGQRFREGLDGVVEPGL